MFRKGIGQKHSRSVGPCAIK